MSPSHLRALRLCAGLSAFVLATSCIASQAQTAAAPQSLYALCSAMSPTTETLYLSNVFSMPASAAGGARGSFAQYVQSRDNTVRGANCSMASSQQQANSQKEAIESRMKQTAQNTTAGAGGKSMKLVETGWSYQAPAAPAGATAATMPTAKRSAVMGAAPQPVGATNPTAPAGATVPATTNYPSANQTGATNTVGGSVSAAGQSVTQGVQQNVNQSVQSMESSTANAATTSINSTITNGMSALQGKLFHKSGSGQAAGGSGQPAANGSGAATGAGAASGSAPGPSNLAAPSAPHDPTKPTIQEEGDGKHSMLMMPGSKDAIELTPVEGSKNVYLDESTGDKYVVLPSGDITHIAKKAPAASAQVTAK